MKRILAYLAVLILCLDACGLVIWVIVVGIEKGAWVQTLFYTVLISASIVASILGAVILTPMLLKLANEHEEEK